jgi:hypothetical protein
VSEDKGSILEGSDGALFQTGQGKVFSFAKYTSQLVPPTPLRHEEVRIDPFGAIDCIEDKLYALDVAIGIVDEVRELEPQEANSP